MTSPSSPELSDRSESAPAPPPRWARIAIMGALVAVVVLIFWLLATGREPMALPLLIAGLALGYTRPGWGALRTRGFWVRALVVVLLAVLFCWVAFTDRLLMALPFVVLLMGLCARWRDSDPS